MPEIQQVFQNTPNFNNSSFETQFIFLGDISTLKFTVFCDQNCDFGFRWSVDNNFQVIDTDTFSLTGGTTGEVIQPITARYCQFFVNNFASLPVDLKTQSFFLNKI